MDLIISKICPPLNNYDNCYVKRNDSKISETH